MSPKSQYLKRLESDDLRPDPVQEKAVDALEHVFESLASQTKSRGLLRHFVPRNDDGMKGLYMYGGVGRGKSMLMDLFYDAIPENILKARVHFHEFMISVHEEMHELRQSGKDADKMLPKIAARIAKESSVLCFDEFHVTDIADAMILGRLFTALFERGVVVVATSNWEPDRLYEGGLQRDRFLPFIALLKEKMDVLHLDSDTDYRSEFIAQEGSYFSPLGSLTAKKMDALFKSITLGARAKADQIKVKGRVIKVREAVAGAARFSFAQLCERPHGAEDYIAITERYETVFLEGVPKLGYDRRNEAKRLMILIDALYEAGTRLVVSAEVAPDKLYSGHDHAFEFDRTISRLNEMQSAEWMDRRNNL